MNTLARTIFDSIKPTTYAEKRESAAIDYNYQQQLPNNDRILQSSIMLGVAYPSRVPDTRINYSPVAFGGWNTSTSKMAPQEELNPERNFTNQATFFRQ
jgi:hypothetical protein